MRVNSEVLYELINDGSIKAGTKLKVYKDDIYVTTITFDGYDFIWETGTFTSGMLFSPLVDFEIIEEDKEIVIDIDKWGIGALEEIGATKDYKIRDLQKYIELLMYTQNEIIDKLIELIDKFNKLKRGE